MTVIKQNRKRLDAQLDDKAVTLLLISDDVGTLAEDVHNAANALLKSGQDVFLITDLAVLKASERKLWFEEGGHYAVVGGKDRVVAVRGLLTELTLSDGTPSPIEIRAALARGDVLP